MSVIIVSRCTVGFRLVLVFLELVPNTSVLHLTCCIQLFPQQDRACPAECVSCVLLAEWRG